MTMNKEYRLKIVTDLFQAYYDARKNKRNSISALAFEKHFERNLFALCDEIIEKRYFPRPNICFIVNKPVKREIFAADFRDRVVHHLIYNYISPVFERTFINDSYSCRKGKGTHYGIGRVNHFIRSCSRNYRRDCYILKLDIKGYFMAMNRRLLYGKIRTVLLKNSEKFGLDLPLVLYLIEKTIYNDPVKDCLIKGDVQDWHGLPTTKSLFSADRECGLPIGNLTSQLFGNIYLNDFDHFVKRVLGIKYYGRYVDDFVLVHPDKEYLKTMIPAIRKFLKEKVQLQLHPYKIFLQHYGKGVKFLGVFIKPYRSYIGNRTKGNSYKTVNKWNALIRNKKKLDKDELDAFRASINSYLGIMRHHSTYRLRKKLLMCNLAEELREHVSFSDKYQKLSIRSG